MHFGFPPEAIIVLFTVVALSVWLDLRAHRDKAEVSLKDATAWSVFWIVLAVAFYGYLYFRYSDTAASLFLSGYVLEKSLSVDNMMVFMAVFASFGVTGITQHRVLYFGIIGALLFRAVFIGAGTAIFGLSGWIELIFAAIVFYTAVKMIASSDEDDVDEDFSDHWSVRFTSWAVPVLPRMVRDRFFVSGKQADELSREHGFSLPGKAALYATPLLLCLVCIEVTDVIFSFDSVPAIIAITNQPFLVYSAVIFAILGLRNLYFMLAAATKYLVHLEKAVAIVLLFVALKLAAEALDLYHLSHQWSLVVVLSLIVGGVLASFIFPAQDEGSDTGVHDVADDNVQSEKG